ncbi:hypothetical protein VCRA2121O157_160058 [Vibrio crassostreae]|nr:hypothetical protein VCRA2119O149_60013 [Vibrio crassostreae]CAK3287940.1 hypothetical protein VCRA2121O157_160058 [Vibrio crassostreae]CAK3760263.1 hypothetical protein VCRA2130O161_160057 [Vibrio crassostreae]
MLNGLLGIVIKKMPVFSGLYRAADSFKKVYCELVFKVCNHLSDCRSVLVELNGSFTERELVINGNEREKLFNAKIHFGVLIFNRYIFKLSQTDEISTLSDNNSEMNSSGLSKKKPT